MGETALAKIGGETGAAVGTLGQGDDGDTVEVLNERHGVGKVGSGGVLGITGVGAS